ncbi:MAG: thiol:disulfide interchange protein DsbA [Lysobacterales bacterium]|jgi:thiol:disulfide interchange protein DsbA|nr:MAG: thiol:disulfide interchange protein DsbA [Xanthomonadales bacterium]
MSRRLPVLVLGLLLSACAGAENARFVEGQHYFRINPPQPTASGNKVEVVELFSYLCIHCANLEPAVKDWKQRLPEHAAFSHMPAIFNDTLAMYGRAFYAAEALGILEASHQALFDALHRERRQFRSLEELAAFYAQFGVSEQQFLDAARSFAVETKLRRAREMGIRYGIDGTPTFVVNGKWRVTVGSAGGVEAFFELIDELIAREAKEKTG